MSNDNRISASVSEQDIADILGHLQAIQAKLPFLVGLDAQERRELAKMGERSIGFDEKCTSYMRSNPEFLPGFVSLEEVNKDRELRSQLLQIFPPLDAFYALFDGTLTLVSSEVWMADLAYYQSVRSAARRGIPGAEAIYNDLRTRFPAGSRSPAPAPATEKP